MAEREKPKRDFPAPWLRQMQWTRLLIYGPIVVVMLVWLLVRFLVQHA